MRRHIVLQRIIGTSLVTLLLVGCSTPAVTPIIIDVTATPPTAATQAALMMTPTRIAPTFTPVPPTPRPNTSIVTPLPPLTKLYLCSSSTDIFFGGSLGKQPCRGFEAETSLFDNSNDKGSPLDMNTRKFDYKLDKDIPGGLYEIGLDLAVCDKATEGKFKVSILLQHGETSTTLGETSFAATSTEFERYTMSVACADPDAQEGDWLWLVVKNLSDHCNKLRYGESAEASYVKVPW